MSNQIYYDKYIKYKLKYDNLKMQLNNQKGGANCLQPQLMPPLFTMMYQYMKNKNIIYENISEEDIEKFLVDTFKTTKISKEEYINMCSKLFNDNLYYKIERIYDRIYPIECKIEDETKKNRLLFINFKSFEILNKDHREKFFEIITKTSPDYICLTEALVPTCFIKSRLTPDIQTNSTSDYFELKKYENDDVVEHPLKDGFTKKVDGFNHPMKESYAKFTKTKRDAYKNEPKERKFTKKCDDDVEIDRVGNVSLNNVWIKFFVDNGYNYLSFGNPTFCPYGENWGNCIISKKKPESSNIFQMETKKTHDEHSNLYRLNLVEEGTIESRCMVHITMNEYGEKHDIICTHLEDSDKDVRGKQVNEIIEYIKNKQLLEKITLVGDLNALNIESYTASEQMLLKKLNNDYLPTEEIVTFNKFFNNESISKGVTIINKGQKYESAFQKCVSHGYSNTYTDSLLIFTDATTFDHQPLLLLKSSEKPLLPKLSEKPNKIFDFLKFKK
jgi:hypothetical protein